MAHIARCTVALIAVLLFSATQTQASPDIVPGMWEITTQIDMPGLPMAIPKNTMQQCLDSKDVVPSMGTEQANCTVNSTKVSGNTVTWDIKCKQEGMNSSSKGTITYNGTSFKGTATITMTSQEMGTRTMNQTMEGKRVGKCTK